MTIESDQDLPHELLEKLKNLELELEDGDITQKGFEKKKATLLEQFAHNDQSQAGTSSVTDNSEVDLGPEPSAADVVDFLDYLPSPTHSPPKPSGAALMEQNHRQLQEQQAQPLQPVQQQQQHQQQQQQYYTSAPQQQQYRAYAPQQQQWQQQQQPVYGYGQQPGQSAGGNPQYYASPRPSRQYDPRMVPRQQPYQASIQSSPSMRHQQYGYTPQPQQRPPSSYRAGPPPPSNQQYRPVYTSAPPQQRPIQTGSPRPVYRTGTVTQQPIRPTNYRPVMPQTNAAHMRTSSLDAVHARPGYSYAPQQRPQHMPPRNIPPEAWRGQ
ncbi:hypothetical protein BJV82DRAFT_615243 [Fennellomyces sp. T-0311]|nr:hypothetical protein BJV82DRAFT_615243 [Fennellomyces sp. T-0311]